MGIILMMMTMMMMMMTMTVMMMMMMMMMMMTMMTTIMMTMMMMMMMAMNLQPVYRRFRRKLPGGSFWGSWGAVGVHFGGLGVPLGAILGVLGCCGRVFGSKIA